MYLTIFMKISHNASLGDTWPLSKKDISCPPRPVQIILSQSSTSLCVIWPPQLLLQPSNILFMAAGAKWLLSDGRCYVVFLKVVVPYQRVALALEHFRKHFNMVSLLLVLCSCSLISPIPLPRPFSQCKIPRGLGRRVISDRCCRKYLHCLALPWQILPPWADGGAWQMAARSQHCELVSDLDTKWPPAWWPEWPAWWQPSKTPTRVDPPKNLICYLANQDV